MKCFSSSVKQVRQASRGAWLWSLLLVLGVGLPQVARATHIRAGDIQATVDTDDPTGQHVSFVLTLYCRYPFNNGVADQRDVDIFFGDGTTAKFPRTSDTPIGPDVRLYTYVFDHRFPASGKYTVSFIGERRLGGIVNMFSSVDQTFYVETQLTINRAYGFNHSPVLNAPAIDHGAVGQVFLHNPAGSDADGDSLSYKLIACRQVEGGSDAAKNNGNTPKPVTCTGYTLPTEVPLVPPAKAMQVPYNGDPPSTGGTAIFVQKLANGQLTWNAPAMAGTYNVAFVVEEWRRTPNGRIQLGGVVRDMQIIVDGTLNLRPLLSVPPDVCVIAGRPLSLRVSATDPSGPGAPVSAVKLEAFSGTIPPATFTTSGSGTSSSPTGVYTWQTECANVSNQPYVVVFKATDSGTPPLVDVQSVNVRVVGPPPTNLRAVLVQSSPISATLTWDRYSCPNASRMLIYRRESCDNSAIDSCTTGIPAALGYVQLPGGDVPITTTTFSDNNNGKGLERGKSYSYRIYAVYPLPAGGASLASTPVCLQINGRAARLTNVDVNVTSATAGQITVKWTQPKPGTGGAFGTPAGYTLYRGEGLHPAAGSLVQAYTTTSLADTTFVDTNLNTRDQPYTYLLQFFSQSGGQPVSELADSASSVYTTLAGDGIGRKVTVSWSYRVPWDNRQQPTRVFRSVGGTAGFSQLGTATSTATGGSFVDNDPALQLGQQYCYYVQTHGQYPDLAFLQNLVNTSQQACVTLQAVPCTPVLSLGPPNCDSLAALASYQPEKQRYRNVLRWTAGDSPTGCIVPAAYYRVFRAETAGGPFALLDSVRTLSYVDANLGQPTYCYQVQAVDSAGVGSGRSNVACQDECLFFVLPNVFTPDGDGLNDRFRPKTSSPLRRTQIKIFSRWGRLVYEGAQDPYINWSGGPAVGAEGQSSGLVSEGTYYYQAQVEFADAAHTTRTYKGWVQVIR